MSVLDDTRDYWRNTTRFYGEREFGDFTAFYATVAVCTVFAAFLIILNIIFCCSWKYKYYWKDSNTGNRWVLPIWTKTPHKQPPLDLTELESNYHIQQQIYETEVLPEYLELKKRESDI